MEAIRVGKGEEVGSAFLRIGGSSNVKSGKTGLFRRAVSGGLQAHIANIESL